MSGTTQSEVFTEEQIARIVGGSERLYELLDTAQQAWQRVVRARARGEMVLIEGGDDMVLCEFGSRNDPEYHVQVRIVDNDFARPTFTIVGLREAEFYKQMARTGEWRRQ